VYRLFHVIDSFHDEIWNFSTFLLSAFSQPIERKSSSFISLSFIARFKMKYFIIIILLSVNPILSSYYRGSIKSWRILNSSSTSAIVELLQGHTGHYYTAICNETQIAIGIFRIGAGNLECIDSCPSKNSILASVAVPCQLDFSRCFYRFFSVRSRSR